MEKQRSFDSKFTSQKCLCCAEKDQMIKKYEKLVQILKKRIGRCSKYSSNQFNLNNTFSSISNENVVHQLVNQVIKEKEQEIIIKQSKQDLDGDLHFSSTVSSFPISYKLKNNLQRNSLQSKYDMSKQNSLIKTAPQTFNFTINKQKSKKINLSTQWLQKFRQLNNKIINKDARIGCLTDEIQSIKSQFLYIRSIFAKFLKSLKLNTLNQKSKQKVVIDTQVKDIINIFVHIFEYSEQQIQQILNKSQLKDIKIAKQLKRSCSIDENKSVYIPRFDSLQIR